MKLYTSLSPSPSATETQLSCVRSWIAHGHTPICVQAHDDDMGQWLPSESEVVRTKPTFAGHPPRPYVGLDAILEAFLASGDDYCGIINGDILINDPAGLLEAFYDGVVCLRRHDHDGDISDAKMFPSGFDMFIITREHALAVPRSLFTIGQTFWDYWLPWSCLQAGHKLLTIEQPIIFHKRHALNYKHGDWVRTIHHFCWLTRRPTNIQPIRVSTEIHTAINRAINKA